MKRIILGVILLSTVILISGCSTVTYTAGGFALGLAKDVKDTYNTLDKADKWFQEHYW